MTATTLTASEARANLYRLMDQTAESHQPVTILGKRNDAVLVSAEDWQAIQETLYLLSVPGMRESIKSGGGVFPPHQHPAPAGVSGAGSSAHGEGAAHVVAL